MEEYAHSDTIGKDYAPSRVVRILNIQQAIAYIKNNVELLDLYTSFDEKTGKDVLVFIFDRQKSKWAYDLWCKHELK